MERFCENLKTVSVCKHQFSCCVTSQQIQNVATTSFRLRRHTMMSRQPRNVAVLNHGLKAGK